MHEKISSFINVSDALYEFILFHDHFKRDEENSCLRDLSFPCRWAKNALYAVECAIGGNVAFSEELRVGVTLSRMKKIPAYTSGRRTFSSYTNALVRQIKKVLPILGIAEEARLFMLLFATNS